jgi:uncharacterized repeat protein (TIGR03803 family)
VQAWARMLTFLEGYKDSGRPNFFLKGRWTMQSRRRLTLFARTFAIVVELLITFPLLAATREKVLHSFNPNDNDGLAPYAGLIFDGSGNLYGTTEYGGTNGGGTVFELIPSTNGTWTEKVLHSFGEGQDGVIPLAGVIFGANGHLYGTTYLGGSEGAGTVFELTRSPNGTWTEKVLHSFGEGQDGVWPLAGLTFDENGNLYSTTTLGGTYGDGTVFELISSANGTWTEKVLHSFKPNGHDALYPEAGLIFDGIGNLYGTAYGGGAYSYGAVFELTSSASEPRTVRVLHSFKFDGKDGFVPEAGLIFDLTGDLYGTTTEGGTYDNGTVFKLTPGADGNWTEKVLHSFDHNIPGGAIPFSGLIFDDIGNLYGTAYVGGAYDFGTAFELTPNADGNWTERVLHSFNPNVHDGLSPSAGLILDGSAHLYGTTLAGGTYGYGTVFEVIP